MDIPGTVVDEGYRKWLFAGDGKHPMGEYDEAAAQESAYDTAFRDGAEWARKEALLEAASYVAGYFPDPHGESEECSDCDTIRALETGIRALTEGDN